MNELAHMVAVQIKALSMMSLHNIIAIKLQLKTVLLTLQFLLIYSSTITWSNVYTCIHTSLQI